MMVLFGITLVLIAVWMARKNWRTAFSVILFFTGMFLFMANHPAFRGFFQSGVITLFVEQAEGYGKQLNRFYTAVEHVQGEIQNTTSNLVSQQAESRKTQATLQRALADMNAQSAALEASKSRIEQLAGQLALAQTNLLAQQDDVVAVVSRLTEMKQSLDAQELKLTDIESLTTAMFEQTTREDYFVSDTNRVVVSQKADGAYGVFMSLEHAPIPQTLDIQLPNFTLRKGCWAVAENNVVLIQLDKGTLDAFKNQPFMVRYVPDPKRRPVQSLLRVSDDGRVHVGGLTYTDVTNIVVK